MPLYVYALTDVPVARWRTGEHIIESISVKGIFAVCEQRPSAPPLTEEELRRQYSIVLRIGNAAPAVLPARFGSLVNRAELRDIVSRRERVIRDALALVRGNAQMTVRCRAVGQRTGSPGLKPWATTPRLKPWTTGVVAQPCGAGSKHAGREYLERRLKETVPELPPFVKTALHRVRHLVISERQSVSFGAAVHHLIKQTDAPTYRATLKNVRDLSVSGPAPPFAFAPELWP